MKRLGFFSSINSLMFDLDINVTKLRSGAEEIAMINIWFDFGICWNQCLD